MLFRQAAVGLTIAVAFMLAPGSAKPEDNQQTAREAAVLLFVPGMLIPGFAAYCNKNISPNEGLIASVKAWNKRHEAVLEKVVIVLQKTGGLTEELRGSILMATHMQKISS